MSKPARTARADVVLVGAGIMSATLGALLRRLEPDWSITLIERLDAVAAESSGPWNNAGTGHSALCELNYTPQLPDGSIDIAKAVLINEQFQVTRQFWAYAAENGTTLHRDYDGEFDYNLAWKPVGGFPISLGWLNAVRRGQFRLHRGLDVGVPNLILRSDRSVPRSDDPAAMQRGDAVLDVNLIARWAGCLGNRSSIVAVADAKHDVFLSLSEPRETAYRQLDLWLDEYLVNSGAPAPSKRG